MDDLYYIRPRREENPKRWMGPLDLTELKQLAGRRQFSRELHEYSTDRQNWRPAKEIWGKVFPAGAKAVVSAQPTPQQSESPPAEEPETYRLSQPPGGGKQSSVPVESPVSEEPEWYYLLDGVQQPATTLSHLRSLAANGPLKPTDLVWCPRFGEQWVESRSVPELAGNAPVVIAADRSRTPSRPDGAIPPLAIASFVMGLLSACALPVLGSILAAVFGHMALAEYARAPGQLRGKGFAVAGVILGYVTLGLFILVMIITAIVFWIMPMHMQAVPG